MIMQILWEEGNRLEYMSHRDAHVLQWLYCKADFWNTVMYAIFH